MSAHVTIKGRVKGVKIDKEGAAVVVHKALEPGATLTETFPKQRVRGKQKQFKQMIPVQDVVKAIGVAAEQTKRTERAEGDRKVAMVQELANRFVDEKLEEERVRTRFQKGKTAAARTASKAVRAKAKDSARMVKDSARAVARLRNEVQDVNASLRTFVRDAYNA
jgi:hypothetical protein